MNEFWIWFSTGLRHILDWNGYDHILYVVVLCVMFSSSQWKKLLLLITAFTIGHSLTLAASTLHIISVRQVYIESLIPLTILATSLVNIILRHQAKDNNRNRTYNYNFNYVLALCFGFIHGMGFSYLLKSMLGTEESIVLPLLSFNLGLEAGQLIIVGTVLFLSGFLFRFTKIKKPDWVLFVSAAVFGIALLLFIQRLNEI